MRILSLVKVRNFAVSQCWARAQNALFVRKIVENHILFVLKMPILVPSSHFLTTFCTKACLQGSRLRPSSPDLLAKCPNGVGWPPNYN